MRWLAEIVVDTAVVLFPALAVWSAFATWQMRVLRSDRDTYRRMWLRNRAKAKQLETKLQVAEASYRALEAKYERFVDESFAAESRLKAELVEARGGI